MKSSSPRPFARLRRSGVAVAILLAAALTGCTSGTNDWSEVKQRPEPSVQAFDHHISVGFRPGSATLTKSEQHRIADFLGQAGAEADNRIAIAPLLAGPTAAAERTAVRRGNTVARYLRRLGFNPVVAAARTDSSGHSDRVDVTLRRYLVSLPSCPNWSDLPGRNFNNQVSSNWGCATATNFGVMVADPADIVRGRDAPDASGERLSQSIERYRTDQVKDLKIETTTEVFATPEGAENDAAQSLRSISIQGF